MPSGWLHVDSDMPSVTGMGKHGVKHPGSGVNQPHLSASTATAQAAQRDQSLSTLSRLIKPHSLKYIVSHEFPFGIRV
jgi:hypothetical protein